MSATEPKCFGQVCAGSINMDAAQCVGQCEVCLCCVHHVGVAAQPEESLGVLPSGHPRERYLNLQ